MNKVTQYYFYSLYCLVIGVLARNLCVSKRLPIRAALIALTGANPWMWGGGGGRRGVESVTQASSPSPGLNHHPPFPVLHRVPLPVPCPVF
jgi:hypothetical protein